MHIKTLLKSGGLAAMAAAMAVTAMPSEAYAQGRPGASQSDDNDRSRGDRRGSRGDQRAARPDRQQERSAPQRGPQGERAAPRSFAGNPGRAPQGDRSRGGPAPVRVADRDGRQNWQSPPRGQRGVAPQRNRTYSDPSRNRGYDGRYRDRDDRRYADRGDFRRWDRNWRGSSRYNWNSWRNSHRSLFSWGAYYAPYRGYSYRRLGIGFYLDSLFYSDRYWIDDPYQYRLPDVYGDYRWVRYYDDALLVDVYTGEVVDVIYDFFW